MESCKLGNFTISAINNTPLLMRTTPVHHHVSIILLPLPLPRLNLSARTSNLLDTLNAASHPHRAPLCPTHTQLSYKYRSFTLINP